MKRTVLLFASLLLILTACANGEKTPDNSQVPSTVTEETQSTPSENSPPVFRIEGELPDIGSFKSTHERYYEDYTTEFIPSEEYGKIIPYAGKYKVFHISDSSEENDALEFGYPSLGLCDKNGKIILDADSQNRSFYYTESNDGFGIYSLYVTDEPQNEVPDDVYIPQKSYIIPESGEWCIELGKDAHLNDAGYGIIYVNEYSQEFDSNTCILYDYTGKEISRLTDFDNLTLSECGLICAMRWDSDDRFQGYIDIQGNVILGPYKSVTPFNSVGTAIIEEDSGFYIIDTEGNRLTTAYANITEYKKDYKDGYGVYVARHIQDNGSSDILDEKGTLLGTVNGSTYYNLRFLPDGDIVYYYTDYDTGEMVWKRISDNSDLICLEYGKVPNKYSGNHNYFVYEDEDTKTGCIFDSNGETVLKIENFLDLHSVSDNGKYFVYSVGNGYNEYYDNEEAQWISVNDSETYLYDLEASRATKLCDGDAYTIFAGEDDRYVIAGYCDTLTLFGEFTSYRLFDSESGKLIFDNCQSITASKTGQETYITVCTKNSCTLYDESLQQIIRTYND